MRNLSNTWLLCVLSGVIVSSVVAQQDEPGIKWGDLTLLPFVSGEMDYDNNVFQGADKADDVYAEYSVGAKLNRETDSFQFDSSLWWSQRFYDTYGAEKDGDRWGLAGMVRQESDKTFGTLLVDVRQVDDYDQAPALGSVPSGFEGTVDSAFDRTGGDKRRLGDAFVGGGYKISDSMSLSAGYKFYAVDYYDDDSVSEGWNENSVGAELSYKATDKAVLYANLQYGLQDGSGAPNGKSADFITARIGMKNTLTDKSTLRFGLGATRYATSEDEYATPSFEVEGLWEATEKVLLFISGRNEIQPTVTGQNSKVASRASSGIRFSASEMISMVASASFVYDRYLDTEVTTGKKPEDLTSIGTLRLNATPFKGTEIFGQLEFTDTQAESEDDYDRFRGSLGASYQF